ncbi:MAG: hypothetical protein OEV30_03390 [Ignavibacteria bacterium]|nr:hypothetical protein [Ignavibacteria bacterium]
MTTKPPPAVINAPGDSVESIAYKAVSGIPTADGHDRDRLGYNIYRWLMYRKDPLEIAVRTAGSRLQISEEEAVGRIRESLRKQGVPDVD